MAKRVVLKYVGENSFVNIDLGAQALFREHDLSQ